MTGTDSIAGSDTIGRIDQCPARAAARAREHELERQWEEWMKHIRQKAAESPRDLTNQERLDIRETDPQMHITDYIAGGE